MSTISNLPLEQINNTGGLCNITLIPTQFIQDLIQEDINSLSVSNIIFKNDIKKIELFFQKTNIENEIDTNESINSKLLEFSIKGILPKNEINQRKVINYINEIYFIVLFTEKNGNKYIVGNLNNPCKIIWKYKNILEAKQYEFEIKQINSDIPALYTGLIP